MLGTIVFGLVTTAINHQIQEREIELKETEQLGKFVEHALNENVAIRRRFAQYFATVTRSDQLRVRWAEYSILVEKEYEETVKEKENVKRELAESTEDVVSRKRLMERLAALEGELQLVKKKTVLPDEIDAKLRSSDAVAYSPDGQIIASATDGGSVSLTDAETGQEKAILAGHGDRVTSLAFSPDGKILATTSYDKTARLWDLATGQLVASLRTEAGLVGLAFSPDGETVITRSIFNENYVWSVQTGELIRVTK